MTISITKLALGAAAMTAAAPFGVLGPSTAQAESPHTREAAAYHLDWIGRIADDQFGARSSRPVVCLVDTAVAVTPDTPATSDTGPIIARLSVFSDDPLAGDPAGVVHGTRMAATIAAPRNGWGIVGINPAARIVSVAASTNGTFDSAATLRAITLCRQWAVQTGNKIAVVNLSLGSPGADPAYATRWTEYVARVNGDGGSVVAAAGNDPARGTQWPAAAENAIAVGAGTNTATGWCSFASRDALTKVVAPGCDVAAATADGQEAVWPTGGSSNAAAVTSGVLAALRALRPGAERQTAEGWLTAGGTLLESARVLDGTSIAGASGLTGLVTPTPLPSPVATPPASTSTSGSTSTSDVSRPAPGTTGTAAELVTPESARVQLKRGALRVQSTERPIGLRLQAAVRSGKRWKRGTGKRTVTINSVHTLPNRVWVRWLSEDGDTSAWTPMGRPSRLPASRQWHETTARGARPPQ